MSVAATTAQVLSATDVARLARAAGFPADEVPTAVAVATAESGLRPRAKNDNPATGDYSIGLWQINMRAHGTRYGTELQLMHPGTNARAAFAIWEAAGRRWSPWGAYTNGSYRQHLTTATGASSGVQGVTALPDPEDLPGVGGIIEGAGDVFDVLTGPIGDVFGLDELFAQLLAAGLALVFSTAALGLIALGLFRLTGNNAGDVFTKAAGVAGGAGTLKAFV